MSDRPLLAELSAPNPAHDTSECLSVFFPAGASPADSLVPSAPHRAGTRGVLVDDQRTASAWRRFCERGGGWRALLLAAVSSGLTEPTGDLLALVRGERRRTLSAVTEGALA